MDFALKRLLGLAICLLLTAPTLALDPSRSIYQYSPQNWTRANGLPVNGVNAIAQTRDGYLWLGTPTGIRCYDPQLEPMKMAFPENQINALLVDRHGSLWVGMADSGVALWRNEQLSILRKADRPGRS
jgi:ligand-binding sensor domain-containing protein